MYHLPMSRVERIAQELKEQGVVMLSEQAFSKNRNAVRLAKAMKRAGVEVPDDRKDKNNG